MGNLGSFDHRQPVRRLMCPFQVGVNLSPHCDEGKCEFGLWCGKGSRCRLRCVGESCRDCGNGVLYSTSAVKVSS